MKPAFRILGGSALLAVLGAGAFVGYKARAVAVELTDPPFYTPKPLARVETTYAELARGGDGDPGGAWSCQEVNGLQLWTLRRARQAPGAVLLLHGFGDDRWGTSPALRWFPNLDASIFTYRRRDDALRAGRREPYVGFGAFEAEEVAQVVRHLEAQGTPRRRIILMGRSLGASVGLLALAKLEPEGPLGGFVWEGAPPSSRDFGERLVRGPKDRIWHPLFAPIAGELGSRWAARRARYDRDATDVLRRLGRMHLRTPSLCFLATQDRLAPPATQREIASHFDQIRIIEVPTWHLHCSDILGPRYAEAIREATRSWLQ